MTLGKSRGVKKKHKMAYHQKYLSFILPYIQHLRPGCEKKRTPFVLKKK